MRVTVLLWSTRRFSQRSVGFTKRRPSTLENSNVLIGIDSLHRTNRRYLNVRGSADFSLGRRSEVAMVLWIGVDDTDSLQGMCTTFLAAEIVRELTEDYDLIGFPRLVRLNPNVPWKTRGNGAICLRFGRGTGRRNLIGELESQPVWSFARAEGVDDPERVQSRIANLVERRSEFREPTTNPGFCILSKQPAATLYWKAVRRIVSKEEALAAVRSPGVLREYKNGRGIIGSLAAAAWRPHDRTYEVLCYRDESRWRTPRLLESGSVRYMDRTFTSTFNNYDYECNRIVIAPHSPCPILFGIRGDDPDVLPSAMRTIKGEPSAGWMVFETNQGTDDHVIPGQAVEPKTTVQVEREVSGRWGGPTLPPPPPQPGNILAGPGTGVGRTRRLGRGVPSASRSAAAPRDPDASGQLDLFDPEPGDSEPPFECLDDERKRDRDGEEDRGDDRKDLEHIAREAFVLRDVADFALYPEHE